MMGSLRIESNYAGGNIQTVEIGNGYAVLAQDLRNTAEWWFYWNFSAVADCDTEWRFAFANRGVIGPWGPATSLNGIDWEWLGAHSRISETEFRCRLKQGERRYFSFALPYQAHHYQQFARTMHRHPLVRIGRLGLSEQLREIPLITIGSPQAKKHLVFTGRHHACEATVSWMVEGLLVHLLQQHADDFLRQHQIHYVPFMDVDGVENGDQGKNRIPHDHNRDYLPEPLYQSVRLLKAYLSALPAVEAAIDFHCSYQWGGRNDHPFIVMLDSPFKEGQDAFGNLLAQITQESTQQDKILYNRTYDIARGEEWNTPGGTRADTYFATLAPRLCMTFVFPYFGTADSVCTLPAIRQFGERFAQALVGHVQGK